MQWVYLTYLQCQVSIEKKKKNYSKLACKKNAYSIFDWTCLDWQCGDILGSFSARFSHARIFWEMSFNVDDHQNRWGWNISRHSVEVHNCATLNYKASFTSRKILLSYILYLVWYHYVIILIYYPAVTKPNHYPEYHDRKWLSVTSFHT